MGKHKHKQKQESAFQLEGVLVRFELEDGYKLKRLVLDSAGNELCIKLTKEARASCGHVLRPGDPIQVQGIQTLDLETGEQKWKAYALKLLSPDRLLPTLQASVTTSALTTEAQPKKKAQVSILVCQKSDCLKRGGQAICQALETALQTRNLQHQVRIQKTGCMKDCKAGPNVVVMPGKARYHHVSASEIPALVDRHFALAANQG